ncbi:MAG: hypothetical protein JOY83_09395, partial [Alphaproteobacteria bacterium]|nr:hypothetical protein [Alphaproteobacteria bacterium]
MTSSPEFGFRSVGTGLFSRPTAENKRHDAANLKPVGTHDLQSNRAHAKILAEKCQALGLAPIDADQWDKNWVSRVLLVYCRLKILAQSARDA